MSDLSYNNFGLKSVIIKDLFGTFNYTIKLSEYEKTTIIFGRNGTGKTTLLKLLDAISRCDLHYISEIQFDIIILEFEKGALSLRWLNQSGTENEGNEGKQLSEDPNDKLLIEFTISDPEWIPIKWPSDQNSDTREWSFTRSEITGNDSNQVSIYKNEIKQMIEELRFRCHYIATQRLLRASSDGDQEIAVVSYSKDLAKRIDSKYDEYSREAETRSRSFPHRVIEDTPWEYADVKYIMELSSEISNIEKSREELVHLGLLPKSEEYSPIDPEVVPDYDVEQAMTTFLICFLRNYAEDEKAKIDIFDNLRTKVKTLINFVNNHFNRKELRIHWFTDDKVEFPLNRDEGSLTFFDERGRMIPISKLSSGEQHLLTWAYELIFLCDDVDMVIIDEPELSMHVEWQLDFVQSLEEISSERGPRFILATHSPTIVDERWELAVKLDDQMNSDPPNL